MSALRGFAAGLRVGWADFRDFWTLRSWLFGWMLRIGTNAFAWVLLGRLLGSQEKQSYLLVGNAVAAGAAAALWASNAVTWARFDGVHPLMVAAPSSLLPPVLGRSSIWLLNGIATSLATFVVLALAFDFRPPAAAWLGLPPLVTLVCASSYAFGTFLGALVGRRIQLRNIVLDLGGTLYLALCGVSVPVSFWPAPVQLLAHLLPLTHGLDAIRGLLAGAPISRVLASASWELLIGLAWLCASMTVLDRFAEAGRADGSIELR
ncbi:MAG: type transporter [Myxococcaceae bacterium]|nr:type transporter [Myxococcaceae bacterium]